MTKEKRRVAIVREAFTARTPREKREVSSRVAGAADYQKEPLPLRHSGPPLREAGFGSKLITPIFRPAAHIQTRR